MMGNWSLWTVKLSLTGGCNYNSVVVQCSTTQLSTWAPATQSHFTSIYGSVCMRRRPSSNETWSVVLPE